MRNWLSFLILAASLCFVPAAKADDTQIPEGFQSLFNGKDLTGWQVNKGGNIKVAIRVELFQELRCCPDLARLTYDKFADLCVLYAIGQRCRVKGGLARAILLNVAGYLLWVIFGVGLGTLMRNQIGSVITGMVIYLIGYAGGILVFTLIRQFLIHREGVLTAAVVMPSIASQIMISPDKLYPESAAWWVGALVMIGWAMLSGGVGVLIMRRRDIS